MGFYALVCNIFYEAGKASVIFGGSHANMARTKQTQRRSDKKGKLPPLGPPRQPDNRWGTAAQTFYERVVLPDNPHN